MHGDVVRDPGLEGPVGLGFMETDSIAPPERAIKLTRGSPTPVFVTWLAPGWQRDFIWKVSVPASKASWGSWQWRSQRQIEIAAIRIGLWKRIMSGQVKICFFG